MENSVSWRSIQIGSESGSAGDFCFLAFIQFEARGEIELRLT